MGFLVSLLVEFDPLFAFGAFSCRILDSASLFTFKYVHNVATEKVGGFIRSNNTVWNRPGLEPRNGDVTTVYFINGPGEILESVARSLFTMNEHAIANVYLYLSFLLRHCKLM